MNKREDFDLYGKLLAELPEQDRNQPDPVQLDPTGFFSDKPIKKINQDEEQRLTDENAVKRSMLKQAVISKVVEDALVNRVEAPTGMDVIKVNFEQFRNMLEDPEFERFSKYAQAITHYTDGRERPIPLRPFVKNEVGMYRGKFVEIDRMPDDAKRGDTPYVQVKADLTPTNDPNTATVNSLGVLGVEPDPFPVKQDMPVVGAAKLQLEVVEGGKK